MLIAAIDLPLLFKIGTIIKLTPYLNSSLSIE